MTAPRANEAPTRETDQSSTAPPRTLTRAQRAIHAIFGVLLVLVALGTAVLVAALLLTKHTPSWWAPPDLSDPAVGVRAEYVERFVSNEMSRPREPGAPWRIAIPEDAATAWVNARLPRWLASRDIDWPLEGAPLLVLFRDRSVLIAGDVGADAGHSGIVGARVRLTAEDGGLGARITAISIGSLTLPPALSASVLRRTIPDDSDQEGRRIIDALLRGERLAEDAVWRVGESRTVRLVDVSIEQGRAVLTCITERSK